MEAVSSGETPMALSISCAIVRAIPRPPGSQPTAEAVELELINSVDCVRVLPVVLNEVDVVRVGEQAGKGRGLGIPQWRGNDSCHTSSAAAAYQRKDNKLTVLSQDRQALFDEKRSIEDNQAEAQR